MSLLGLSMLLSSCSASLYEIAIDIRQPAVSPIDMEEKSIAIYVAPYEQEKTIYRDSLVRVVFASGIASGLEKALDLSEGAVYVYNHYPPKDSEITMDYIQSLSRQADSDVVILVDSVDVSDFSLLENVVMGASREIQYMYASFTSKISVYDGITAKVIAQVDQKDTIYWELLTKSDLNIVSSREGTERVINMLSPMVGNDIAARFFPSWVTEYRYLFIYDLPLWIRADSHAEVFEWDEAISIWVNEVNSKNKYKSACAAINIAVGCEMTGRPELALEWLESAEKIYNSQKLGLNNYKLRLKYEIEKRQKEQAIN